MSSALSRTAAVASREWGAALDGPALRTAALVFSLSLGALYFFVGYPIGELRADGLWQVRTTHALAVVFAWLPLLFAGLAAALTMASWSEERRAGTEEMLLAWPVAAGELVLGKFLAAFAQLCLLLTVALVPLFAATAYLGPVDWGAAVGGFLGALLLGAGYLALGQLLSACTRDPLSAFLITALALLVSWSPMLVVGILPGALADGLVYASPASHYLLTSARGLFDLRDLLFHGLLCAAALHLCTLVVEARRWK